MTSAAESSSRSHEDKSISSSSSSSLCPLCLCGEIFLRVVDSPICAEGRHHVYVRTATDGGDRRSRVLGQLHTGGADAPRRADD